MRTKSNSSGPILLVNDYFKGTFLGCTYKGPSHCHVYKKDVPFSEMDRSSSVVQTHLFLGFLIAMECYIEALGLYHFHRHGRLITMAEVCT